MKKVRITSGNLEFPNKMYKNQNQQQWQNQVRGDVIKGKIYFKF